jgi:hypothetical protein
VIDREAAAEDAPRQLTSMRLAIRKGRS